MPRVPNYNKPLPGCEGPKLRPFKHRKAAVEFKRFLSDDDSGIGGHAHVFEVSIRSNTYALKVVSGRHPGFGALLNIRTLSQFKFYDSSEDEGNLSDGEKETISISRIRAHMDPFYNECRAYGRLVETGLNGKIAVRCYGYLTLPAAIEDELDQKFNVATWDRPDEDLDKSVSERQPLRAIVKELIRNELPFTVKDVSKMLHHLKRLRRLGIYPVDVAARNYRAGLLVDFSAAMTKPHYLFEKWLGFNVSVLQRDDLLNFDKMIKDAKLNTWVRATPNPEYLHKLRRPPQRPQSFR